MTADELLWPPAGSPSDLAEIERIPLSQRGLPASTYELVRRAAALWPDRDAVSVLPDAKHWQTPSTRTFAQLAGDVHRAAGVLHALGVRRGDAVAVMSVNCAQLLELLLAAEAVGVYAPIKPGLSAEHATQLVRRAGARVIVACGPELDADVWSLAREIASQTGARALLALRPTAATAPAPALEPLEGVEVAYLEQRMAVADDRALPCAPPSASDIASYLHTGGTTGTPKLAARTHGNEVSNAWMIACTVMDAESTVFAALPLFHTNALLVTVLAPLLRGQHVVWGGPFGYRDVALYSKLWKIIERYRVAAMSAVPTFYYLLAQVPITTDISSLKLPLVGAAPLAAAVRDAFESHTGVALCEGYGLTEGTCASSRSLPDSERPGSVGQRLPYQEARAVAIDDATGDWTFLPPGKVGTLVLRGPNVFAGYLGPEGRLDSGGKLRDGWLDTGDLASVDADGFIRLAGRAKDLIIRGGHVPERAAAPKRVDIVDAIPLASVGKPYKPELRPSRLPATP